MTGRLKKRQQHDLKRSCWPMYCLIFLTINTHLSNWEHKMKNSVIKLAFTLMIVFTAPSSFAGLINDISAETIQENISVTNSSGTTFNWRSSYDISFVNQDLIIDVDVFLAGFDPGQALRDIWEDGIESIWSNAFDISDGTYYYDTIFNVDWLTSPSNSDHFVIVREGNGNVDLANWYTGTPSGRGFNNQGRVAAHEFGHMIGLLDEYNGGATLPGTVRSDSIMGQQLSSPQEDHYYAFTNWLSVNSGVNSLSLVADSGSHNYVIDVPEPSSLFIVMIMGFSFVILRRKVTHSSIRPQIALS